MGLFNKAGQIETGNSKPVTDTDANKTKQPSTGLISRSEKTKQKSGLFERASSAVKSQVKKPGLLERARKSLGKGGLLDRASNSKPDASPKKESANYDTEPNNDTPDFDNSVLSDTPEDDNSVLSDTPDFDNSVLSDTPEFDSSVLGDTPEDDNSVLGDTPEDDNSVLDDTPEDDNSVFGDTPEDDNSVLSDTPEDDNSVLGDDFEFDTSLSGDFEFEDKSPDQDDPARSLTEASQNQPFEDWQQEAADLAEHQAKLHLGDNKNEIGFYSDEISTTPVEMHIGSQKRIDNYLALFELNRELNTIDDAEDFFDTALYSVLGQLSARSVIVFAQQLNRSDILYPVAYTGVSVGDDWNLNATGALFQSLSKSDEIRYSGEFLKEGFGLNDLERSIFDQSKVSLLLPLRNKKNLVGVIFIGPPLDKADYVIDDLEYLRLLSGNLVGPLERIRSIAKHQTDTRLLTHHNELYRSLAEMNSIVQTKKTIDEIYDVAVEYFKNQLKVESLSLVLLDPAEQNYKIFAGNQISPGSLKRFKLPVAGSELIATISNLSGVYNLVEFKNHSEIIASYTGDDLALMQFYQILPLINLNWLVGFITIHKTSSDWTDDEREIGLIAANQLAPVFANCLIINERETLFRDPFSPLEKRLGLEVQKALEFHSFLSIVDFKVKNVKKLLGANPMPLMTEFFQAVSRAAARGLHTTDYLSRMGPGRFVILLPGRNSKEAEILSSRLQIELKQANLLRGSAVAPNYSFEIINFPDDGDTLQKLIARLDQ